MCRILFAAGNGHEIRELLDAFVRSSENDPYKARRNRGSQHKDGWGYVLLKRDTVEHYRSMTPVFQDEAVQRLRDKLSGFTVLIAHSRAASQGSRNLFNVQPFGFSSRRGFSFWFLHNGDLKKDMIIRMAELEAEKLENASDSFTAAVYLCRFLEGSTKENLLARFKELKKTTNTALNTVTLMIDPLNNVRAFITSYMTGRIEDAPQKRDYYRLLILSKKNLFAVASSTFELYHDGPFQDVENGEAFHVEISFENEGFAVERLRI
ncbi:class II glutamine amidotransferase [Thermococcus atlanticus]